MLEYIKNALTAAIQERCNCEISYNAIGTGEFSCQTTINEVVYRSKIRGTSNTFTATELLAFVEDWIATEGTFVVFDTLRLRTSTECPLHIQSFHEPECATNATMPSTSAGSCFHNCLASMYGKQSCEQDF